MHLRVCFAVGALPQSSLFVRLIHLALIDHSGLTHVNAEQEHLLHKGRLKLG